MSLQDDLITAWNADKPITAESGLSIALTVLETHPKEKVTFEKWWEKNGIVMVEKINAGL